MLTRSLQAYLLLIPHYCADCQVVTLLRNWLELFLGAQVSPRLHPQDGCGWFAALPEHVAVAGGGT